MVHLLTALALATAGSSPPVSEGQCIVYVNAAANGSNDGSSWHNAFVDLQDALSVSAAGDEIWVATGTYKPDRGTGDRSATFNLVCGASLYGGFAGWETSREQRDWQANETVLSGDLNDDDGPANCAEVSNCCVLHAEAGCDDPVCEALVCAADWRCCEDRSPPAESWFSFCVGVAQRACCHLGSWQTCDNSYRVVSLTGCSSLTVFDGLTVIGGYSSFYRDGDPTEGAGIYVDTASFMVSNCHFAANWVAGVRDAPFADRPPSTIDVSRCTFDGPGPGLGIITDRSNVNLRECDFFDGERARVRSVYLDQYGATGATMERCYFNSTNSHLEGDVTVNSCFFEGSGASLYLWDGEFQVSNCSFLGAGGLGIQSGAGTVDNCVFIGSGSSGGNGGSGLFRNCVFLNGSPYYPALGWSFGNLYVLNCTIVGNAKLMTPSSSLNGGVNVGQHASGQVLNSIIWGNGNSPFLTTEQNQIGIWPANDSTLEIDYSIVEGWSGILGGDGNSGLNPMLADVDGPDDFLGTEDDDARLLPGSLAINAGYSSSYLTPADLDGHSRVLCGAVDLGPYEFGIGDYDCDREITSLDVGAWPSCMSGPNETTPLDCPAFDFNGNENVDLVDFAAFQRAFAP